MAAPVDPEMARAVEAAAQALCDAGHHVEEAVPQIDLPAIDEACLNIWYYGFDAWLDELGRLAGQKVGPQTVERQRSSFTSLPSASAR
ncbi:hypothetical protein [Taklimakanibacter deserti]|uniref:hypothetical protein n=1 Tax=Taklimakanibacter deserti TaxID=2267839 RepID=UPI0013C49256